MPLKLRPTLDEVKVMVAEGRGNTIPIFAEISADLLTPVSAYLRVADRTQYSFLLESVAGGEQIGRYSFIGADPYKIIKTGENEEITGDPLKALERELANIRYVKVPGLPSFTGGAIGYIAFDCYQYFEPRTARDLADPLAIPDAVFLFCDTVVVMDRLRQVVNVVSHYRSEATSPADIESEYNKAAEEIEVVVSVLNSEKTPVVPQGPVVLGHKPVSNVGKEGYEGFVTRLKHHIREGDIFQAVPSQRLARPTSLHPFNIYRHLRQLNPSPYMFYLDLKDFKIVGASPEMLVKVEDGTVYTHPIAGTRKRGKTPAEDEALAQELLADHKERAEHVMLVDLGRNDVNRVCIPETVTVDKLMLVERYSHVMHIVSNVSGKLREDKTPFDAFRAIFPAGTVSGAPKIRAVELISELEGEKRGIYAGSVGHFDYSGGLDTCIAIRTILHKDGVCYLQGASRVSGFGLTGGGIVYDSVEEDEFDETINKLDSNLTAISQCEIAVYEQQQEQ
ncbi:anthranilate synthase component I [Jimgerdemannia flammicorona]|uniref:anthranilate synthase n=1 Tax=Jimgerdemannia flammicorona TaxID=994334 RepID=A0A433QKQ0_9FUNG|nr:anthranilate synthase component I [Jimgerdemannia flammicorona]